MKKKKFLNLAEVDLTKNIVRPTVTNVLYKRALIAEIEAQIREKEVVFAVTRIKNEVTRLGWERHYSVPFLTFFDALAEVVSSLRKFTHEAEEVEE